MSKMPQLIKKRKKSKKLGQPNIIKREEYQEEDMDTRLELIRALIPIGLCAVYEELDREVSEMAGKAHKHKGNTHKNYRYGSNPGSVKLAGQRIPVKVPRVRGPEGEIRLQSYDKLHHGGELNEMMFRQVLYGISCRNYERAAADIPGAIGISSSSVSRNFIEMSTAELHKFQERDLSGLDIVAMFVDGKSFAEDEMVISLGVTVDGNKHFLGFIQTGTENERSISQFFQSLTDRGLNMSCGFLVVIDGSKGFRAAVRKVFGKRALVQRCQWHKRENIVSYLPKKDQAYWRKCLQKAYERPNYNEARQELLKIRSKLAIINESAVRSLDEGFEETLTLHRLGLFSLLGKSLKTTNIIESVNAQAEERCSKVDHWKNSNQKHRWLAAALLDIEPRLNKLMGYRHLPSLQKAIMKDLNLNHITQESEQAA